MRFFFLRNFSGELGRSYPLIKALKLIKIEKFNVLNVRVLNSKRKFVLHFCKVAERPVLRTVNCEVFYRGDYIGINNVNALKRASLVLFGFLHKVNLCRVIRVLTRFRG